jgi:hypothetical protein
LRKSGCGSKPIRKLMRRTKPKRDELVEFVKRLMPDSATYDSDREAYWAALLDACVDPATWDAAAIVEHALSYRPIEL